MPLTPGLLRLDVGRPNHLAPLLGFVGDELAEVGRRANKHRAAEVSKPRLQPRIGNTGVNLLVKLLDNVGWRASRCANTSECTRLKTWHGIADGWNVWEWIQPRNGCHAERAQLARFDVFGRTSHRVEQHLNLTPK